MATAATAWNLPLLIGAGLSAVASLLHLGCIVFGPSWYRVFGAGEHIARMAEARDWRPALITGGIACVLAIWSLYALSGAGAIPPLPLLWPALWAIGGIYTLRGLAGLLLALARRGPDRGFWIWSSVVCLAFGLVHVVGLVQRGSAS